MALTFRECQPNGTRYNARIDDATWNLYRHRLERMHNQRLPRATMLDVLKHDYRFHPSLPQLNARMKLWGYAVYASKHGPTPPLSTQGLDADSDPEQGAEQINLPTELGGSPITVTVSTLSREDSRQSDFSSPSECSESTMPDFQVITEDGDVPPKDTERSYEATREIPVTCSGAETLINASLPLYCSQSCCENMIRNHKYMIAAQFLASLQCTSSASNILFPMVADMGSDPSVASSDHVWANVNCNRLSDSLSATDQRKSIWSMPAWQCIHGPLREYILSSNSISLPGPLAHLTLTSQYRKIGAFTHNQSLAIATLSSSSEVRILYEEIMRWEMDTNLLLRLMLWSLRTLLVPAFRSELRQIAVHLGQLKEHAKLPNLTLQRVLACQFLTTWIEAPCPDISKALVELNGSFGASFSLEVMLPEAFVSLARMILAKGNHSPVPPGLFKHDAVIDRFVEKTSASFEALCRSPVQQYVAEFAQSLLLVFSQSLSEATPRTCQYSEQLTEKLAFRIMGKGHVDRYGSEQAVPNPHLGWMPLADCFKVHGVTVHNTPTSTVLTTVSPQDVNPLAESFLSSHGAKHISCAPLAFSAATSPSIGETVTTAVDAVVALSLRPSLHSRASKDRDDTDPSSKRTLAIRVTRTDTKSSGKMSIDSMRELSSRTQARQTAREIGPVRNSSSSSRMTLGSQFSFTKVTGLGRGNSTASKFSFTPEDMSVDATTPCMDERSSHAHTGEMTEEAAELHRKVTEWITREFSPKKRPDFNRRSTEPAFMMEGSRLRSELMLVEVQGH